MRNWNYDAEENTCTYVIMTLTAPDGTVRHHEIPEATEEQLKAEAARLAAAGRGTLTWQRVKEI